MQTEFERISQKYEAKRRAVKDLETEIAWFNTQLDWDRAIFSEKNSNAE
jgi:predicted  nucleic acid-binding Zn-ribbon protein